MTAQSKKTTSYLILSFALTLGLGIYFFSNHSISEVYDAIRGVPSRYIVSFFVCSILMSVFRAWRYFLLLLATGYRCSVFSLFLVTLIRNIFSDLLPARLGGLIYIYLVKNRLNVPLNAATSTFAYAFLFDVIAVCPLVALCLVSFVVPEQINSAVIFIAVLILFLFTILLIYKLSWFLSVVLSAFHRIRGVSFPKVEKALEELKESLDAVGKSKIYGRILLLSAISRTFKYAGLYVFLLGLGYSLGLDREAISLQKGFLGLVSAEFAASLPISGIAGFGAYESAWTFTFSLMGVEQRVAEMTAFSHHLFTQAYGYSLGFLALAILLIPFPSRKKTDDGDKSVTGLVAFSIQFLLVTTLGVLLAASPLYSEPLRKVDSSFSQWLPGEALPEIVFDSNRSGRFGIYATGLNSKKISQIVDTVQHEMFPDVSPHGKYLAFSRHRTLSRRSPADVVIFAFETGQQEVIKDGVFPTFSADGASLFFERGREKVVAFDLKTKQQNEIFPGKRFSEFEGFQVVKPRLSPDGKYLAFTSDKQGRWHAWLANLETGEASLLGNGCEPTFFRDSKSVVWVSESGAKQGSGFKVFKIEDSEVAVLLDRDKPYGREYFPSVSSDNNHLIFSAAPPGDHSHESANYQIFTFNIANGLINRLTDDSYTNRWPKFVKQ